MSFFLSLLLTTSLNLPVIQYATYAPSARMLRLSHCGPNLTRPYFHLALQFDTNNVKAEAYVSYSITIRNYKDEVEKNMQFDQNYMNMVTYYHQIDPPKSGYESKRTINVTALFDTNTANRIQFLSLEVFYEVPTTHRISNLFSYTSPSASTTAITNAGQSIKQYEKYIFDRLIDINLKKMLIDPKSLILDFFYTDYNSIGLYSEEVYLLLYDVYQGSDIPRVDDGYKIPLKMKCATTTCTFQLVEQYYYDPEVRNLFISNGANRRAVTSLTIPPQFAGEEILYELRFLKTGVGRHDFIVRSHFKMALNPFGDCSNSYYCVGSVSETLKDAEYERRS